LTLRRKLGISNHLDEAPDCEALRTTRDQAALEDVLGSGHSRRLLGEVIQKRLPFFARKAFEKSEKRLE
jgi:hypothetical protein